MAIAGNKNSGSFQIVSVQQPTTIAPDPDGVILPPHVIIGVPMGPGLSQLIYQIVFNWVQDISPGAPPVGVENFTESDIEINGGTIDIFTEDEGENEYNAIVSVPADTNGMCEITVRRAAANLVGTTVPGPENPVTESFRYDTRTASFNINVLDICEITQDIIDNSFLNGVFEQPIAVTNAGGAFNGVMESIHHGDFIYMVVQVEKNRQVIDMDGNPLDRPLVDNAQQAGAALIAINMDDCTWSIVKAYSEVTLAARSLEIYNDKLFFVEGNFYAYSNNAHFWELTRLATPISGRYATASPSVEWKSKIGNLYSLDLNTYESNLTEDPELLGLNRRSATTDDNPVEGQVDYYYGVHGSIRSPLMIKDGVIHMITGYGDDVEAIEDNAELPVDAIGNWQWVRYGTELNKRISNLITNDKSVYEVLRGLSIALNAVIGFEGDTLFVKPRELPIAQLSAGIMSGATDYQVDRINRDVQPETEYMLIGEELVLQRPANTIIRSQFGTEDAVHNPDEDVYFFDHVISMENKVLKKPILNVDVTNDYRQFYNVVTIAYGNGKSISVPEDQSMSNESIANYGRREFTTNVDLDDNQRNWVKWIAETYLKRFEEPRLIIEMTLKLSLKIKAGEPVFVHQLDRVYLFNVCQALEVRHNLSGRETTLRAVSIS